MVNEILQIEGAYKIPEWKLGSVALTKYDVTEIDTALCQYGMFNKPGHN